MLVRFGIWREWHAADERGAKHEHDHVAVLGAASFRLGPLKKALLERHGLGSHWSCTHDGYWSCVRYCAILAQRKSTECLDARPYL